MSCCQADGSGCCPAAALQVGPQLVRRPLEVEFLYLDRTVCERCRGTEAVLREAVDEAQRILGPTGVDVSLKMTHVGTEAEACALGFVSSPTVRLMGRDAAVDVRENLCSGCGDLAGCEITCRIWTWRGKSYSVLPKEMFLDSILREAYLHPADPRASPAPLRDLPENLRRFFRARQVQLRPGDEGREKDLKSSRGDDYRTVTGTS